MLRIRSWTRGICETHEQLQALPEVAEARDFLEELYGSSVAAVGMDDFRQQAEQAINELGVELDWFEYFQEEGCGQ